MRREMVQGTLLFAGHAPARQKVHRFSKLTDTSHASCADSGWPFANYIFDETWGRCK